MEERQGIKQQFTDERLKNMEVKPQSQRDREAYEYLVKESVNTMKAMGREVTEDQVRKELGQICEGTSEKRDRGGHKKGE